MRKFIKRIKSLFYTEPYAYFITFEYMSNNGSRMRASRLYEGTLGEFLIMILCEDGYTENNVWIINTVPLSEVESIMIKDILESVIE